MPERNLSAGLVARVGDRVVYPALFFEGTFFSAGADTLLNVWSGIGSFVWNGKTWLGQGNLLGFSEVEESTDLRAIGFQVVLNGQKATNISLALQSARQGKPGHLWLGLLTQAGALADTPVELKRGKLDVIRTQDAGDDCRILVAYEDVLVDLTRPRERRYTDEDQQIDYAGDLGFAFVETLQDMQIPWGRATA